MEYISCKRYGVCIYIYMNKKIKKGGTTLHYIYSVRKIRQCEFYGNRYFWMRMFYTKYGFLLVSEKHNTKIFLYIFLLHFLTSQVDFIVFVKMDYVNTRINAGSIFQIASGRYLVCV